MTFQTVLFLVDVGMGFRTLVSLLFSAKTTGKKVRVRKKLLSDRHCFNKHVNRLWYRLVLTNRTKLK